MSTLLRIKRSDANAAPDTLSAGELAYSYLSNTLFVGTSSGVALNIGGKTYIDLLENASAANGDSTLVRRYANGSAQFQQLDILVEPSANSHVATKQYVDDATANAATSLNNLTDVVVVGDNTQQNNKILIGHANGNYLTTDVTGNVSISNTGVLTIGSSQVTNDMLEGSIGNDKLVNDSVTVTAGEGLIGGGTVALGGTITLDVVVGDGLANTGDSINVDSTVVRTDRTQTVNGSLTFSNTIYFTNDIDVTGNIYLNGNTTFINVATLNVSDPLIYLAANNDVSDLVDIGFMGGKNTAGIYSHTGLVRDASDGTWHLFDGLADEGHEGNVVDFANTYYALLRANLESKQLTVTGTGSYANIDTTLEVSGNTTLQSNLSVAGDATVTGTSKANSFVSTRTALAAPNLGNYDGERLRLFDFDEAGHPNYAIGVESNNIWMGVDDSANTVGFKWYGNTSQAMRLSGNGVLEVANTIISDRAVVGTANIATLNVSTSAWISSLSLETALGVGSGGTGYSTLTANGVLYADTVGSFDFATGTDGQVLQISSGVPTFADVDGGTF